MRFNLPSNNKKKFCLVSNGNNPDMADFFRSKLGLHDVIYYKNKFIKTSSDYNVGISSFSKSSSGDFYFFIDFLISVFLGISFLFRSVKIVMFDNSHISNLPLAFFCRIFGIKCIFTIHDWQPHPGSRSFVVRLYNYVVKNILANELIVFSNVEANGLSCNITKFKLAGFDDKNISVDFRSSESQQRKNIVFFGRMEPYKGLGDLVKIIPILREMGVNNEIVIAGSGFDPSLLILKDIPGVIVINRFIEENEVDSIFGSACLSVLPYSSATQSGVSIMSYMYSVPVVAFNVGNLAENIEYGVNGFYVNSGDNYQFSLLCKQVLDNHSSFSSNARSTFLNNHTSIVANKQFEAFVLKSMKDI
jgi:glycosyltransferase involved in cell wall biosynthesis